MKTKTARKTKNASFGFENRVRYNWGFWDGVRDNRDGLPRVDGLTVETIEARHYDSSYSAGYVAGWYQANGGWSGNSSQGAWDHDERIGKVTA